MKKFGIFALGLFCWGQFSDANTVVIYRCTPVQLNSIIEKVILSEEVGRGYTLTVFKDDSQTVQQAEDAQYYDDMTYFGYYSKTLGAALEFDYPETKEARFYLGEKLIAVSCVKQVP